MILVDAVFINDGGGRILFDYLFSSLLKAEIKDIIFLLDKRIYNEYCEVNIPSGKIIFIDGFVERCLFYKNKNTAFSKVLCFGNIPPNKRLNAEVYTYFHQPMFLKVPKSFKVSDQIKFKLKVFVLNLFKKNSDYWLVQSDYIKKSLEEKFNLKTQTVSSLPFYPEFTRTETFERSVSSFLYVSNATPHKNHIRLIEAFCLFYDAYKEGILTLTVDKQYLEVFELINSKKALGYPINNLGFVDREELYEQYQKHRFLVFPSFTESFGLGIVEAIENGCNIIGADLPYMHEVCSASLLFDPNKTNDILDKLSLSRNNTKKSQQKIRNEVDKLINILK